MPVSKKQLSANRKNAQKSPGPKTPEGTATVSRNATKYGFFAKDVVIRSKYLNEDPNQYQALLDDLTAEFRPESPLQQFLVVKIANSLWRYRRAIAAETGRAKDQLRKLYKNRWFNETATKKEKQEFLDRYAYSETIPDEDYGFNIQRYEMRLDFQLNRAYRMLAHLKKHAPSLRAAPPVPSPGSASSSPNSDRDPVSHADPNTATGSQPPLPNPDQDCVSDTDSAPDPTSSSDSGTDPDSSAESDYFPPPGPDFVLPPDFIDTTKNQLIIFREE